MDHSNVVGGSTAKRVINCPASVKLVQKMPPKPSSEHADRGTLLHNVIAELLEFDKKPEQCIGAQYKDQTLTQELIDEKIIPALAALDEIDPDKTMEYMVETRVAFGDFLPGVFGSTDLLGRKGKRAIVLDWKFGDGVLVDAVENPQLLFYAAAAMRTPAASWVFEGVEEIECIIVQPPAIRRWVTTLARVKEFEQELLYAVRLSSWPEPPMQEGDHCRWCAAKPICPRMTGAVERALKAKLIEMPAQQIAAQLRQADMVESYITDLRALAFDMLQNGVDVPGYKLVAKQARRQWVDKAKIEAWADVNNIEDAYEPPTIKSPAQLEKVLKKAKIEFPADMVVSVSSGDTLAADTDPRPAVLQIGKQLTAALSKIQ
ncbi:Protein of unknown function DUF2800 [uncultured Caudovirales phage]|uniref:DUF2800 domain-containing protein n=1 Tax=uncultured Caudovirales phage TaxID=2100421 RepID=A0A6J7X190_9CAUD|nr:Protein of unknown function DUF2800 [uncultured Caudovirales phage]